MQYVPLFLTALPIAFVIDLLWIGVVANRFYRDQLGTLFTDAINWPAAIAFYIIYIAGLTYFVIAPAVESHSLAKVLIGGALFGLVAYATYDLTSLAVIKNWPVLMTFVDMLWGTIMTTGIATATYLVATTLLGR